MAQFTRAEPLTYNIKTFAVVHDDRKPVSCNTLNTRVLRERNSRDEVPAERISSYHLPSITAGIHVGAHERVEHYYYII